jgi:hypothetical protein
MYIVEIAFDDVNVRGDRTQKVVRFPVCDVSGTDDLLDFTWHEEFFEFRRERCCAGRNVKVTNDKD